MLRLLPLLLALALLLPCPARAQDMNQDQCRRVTVRGSIQLRPDPQAHVQEPDRGVVICTGTGDLSMDLIFPPDGGPALAQDNSVSLTAYTCYSFGTAEPCTATPHAAALEHRPFHLQAELVPGDVRTFDAEGNPTGVKDAFNFRVNPLPAPDAITVTMECGGAPGDVSDPTVFFQLLMPFIESYWNHTAALDESKHETFTDYPVTNGMFLADMEWTTSEEFAACPQTR